jgi:class 3 adenylate cyclase
MKLAAVALLRRRSTRSTGHRSFARQEEAVPIFVDRHDLKGMTAADVAEAHRKDLELQDEYGVRFLTYWFDDRRGSGFCLIDAPDIETAKRVHHEAHGGEMIDVISVDLSAVEAFLGRVSDPAPVAGDTSPAIDSAFRAVMFTDIVDSTGMTARLGDVRAVEMVRAHDAMVRRALKDQSGREVKHTGDGIMAAFNDASAAVTAACHIQRSLAAFNRSSAEPLRVRIGIHAGEPVEDSNDLFGGTVQLAARICQDAAADAIVVSHAVRQGLADARELTALGPRAFKGFADPVEVYQVAWQRPHA